METKKNYFEIKSSGFNKSIGREEIIIHAGKHGVICLHQDGDKLGFIVDVYGENDICDTMCVWDEDLDN